MPKESESYNQVTQAIIGAAIQVHKSIGPGLLESAYEACLAYELGEIGLTVERQKPLPLVYKNIKLDCGNRVDILIEEKIIVEVKAIDQVLPVHLAQMLSYLRISGCKVGLLINFNEKLLKHGIHRIVNNLEE
jgi:GxxExxY protein